MWSLAPAEYIKYIPPSGVKLLAEDCIIIIANQKILSSMVCWLFDANQPKYGNMDEKTENNFAFIDSQNLNLGVQGCGWKLDFARFYIYLITKNIQHYYENFTNILFISTA